jgi:hypothetical protein
MSYTATHRIDIQHLLGYNSKVLWAICGGGKQKTALRLFKTAVYFSCSNILDERSRSLPDVQYHTICRAICQAVFRKFGEVRQIVQKNPQTRHFYGILLQTLSIDVSALFL